MAHLKADTALLGNNKELNEFLEQNKTATLRSSDHSPEDVYNYFFSYLNIKVCGYLDLNSKRPIFDPNRSLVLLHVNIRSLHKNFDNLYDFLVELNFLPDVICLTETRIKLHPLLNISFLFIQLYSFRKLQANERMYFCFSFILSCISIIKKILLFIQKIAS